MKDPANIFRQTAIRKSRNHLKVKGGYNVSDVELFQRATTCKYKQVSHEIESEAIHVRPFSGALMR